jgi:asparagine synthase (glutamine-hydrolysing)
MAHIIGAFGTSSEQYEHKIKKIVAQRSDRIIADFIKNNDLIVIGAQNKENNTQKIIKLPDDNGIFIGRIFDKVKYEPAKFDAQTSQKILNDSYFLINNFWGSYVGILYDESTHNIKLIRDPLGLSTIFYAIQKDCIIFSSELSLLYDVLEEKPSINWDYFAQYIAHHNQVLSCTPFHGIQELLPGIEFTYAASGVTNLKHLWDINSIASNSCITDVDAFEHELLQTLKSCVKAWTFETKGICVELSGGLDSSSVTILLRDILPQSTPLHAINYIDSKVSSSNEIEHAQEVANACNVPLHFIDYQTHEFLHFLRYPQRPNRPKSLYLSYDQAIKLKEFAKSNGCSDILNGQGGDHVFLAPTPSLLLSDFWLGSSVRKSFSVIKELSTKYRTPWWGVIKPNLKAVADYYQSKRRLSPLFDTSFLESSYAQKFVPEKFYLNDKMCALYPARAKQVEGLFHALYYCEGNEHMSSFSYTHPLISQPIVELALKIPTYQSYQDNYDRIFFRKAVSRIKKPNALWRTIKGQTTSSVVKNCAAQADELYDFIKSGDLYKSGILNKKWLHENIIKMKHGQNQNLWPILHIIVSQMWITQWSSPRSCPSTSSG